MKCEEEKMDEKTVNIKVKVDNFMTVDLNIPQVVEATELEAMLDRAKRIAKAGHIHRDVSAMKREANGPGTGHRILPKDPAEQSRIVKAWNKANKDEQKDIAARYGVTKSEMSKKIYYITNKEKWKEYRRK